MKRMGWAFLMVISLFAISCSKSDIDEEMNAVVTTKTSGLEQEVMQLVNAYRTSKGLNALEFDATAYVYANEHTDHMIANGEISHDDFDLRSSNLALEADADYVSENVGRNYTTAGAIVGAWAKSPAHKKVMEGDFTHSAVSAKANDQGVLYFTQLFFR